MSTLFISDLHLEPSSQTVCEKFLNFLHHEAAQAAALYLLGDIFEVWIGDDTESNWHSDIKIALKKLTHQDVPVFFMHGNRDFLVGQRFMMETGCQFLAEPSVVSIYNKKILLLHGDTLCLDDTSYLRFRTLNRSPLIQRIFLALPMRYRQRLANKIRVVSQQKNTQLQDITPSEIARLMDLYGVDLLIHGHTHRPSLHYFNLNHKPLLHVVLSDWHERGNVLEMKEDGEIRLRYF